MRILLLAVALAAAGALVPIAAADPVTELLEEGPEPTGCRPYCVDELLAVLDGPGPTECKPFC